MTIRYTVLITLALLVSACASKEMKDNLQETRDNVDLALAEAAAVEIPEPEAPPEDVLDELIEGSGISVPGLDADIRLETAFDISVSNAPARLFFMSLVKDTSINMVVHPDVAGEISLDLKNVTVREVMKLAREVYGYEYQENEMGYIVLPARIQSRIFEVNYLNVERAGESTMSVSSGAVGDGRSRSDEENQNINNNRNRNAAQKSSRIKTKSQTDFWTDLQATLTSIVGGGPGRTIVVDRHAGLVIVRAMPGELRDVEAYLTNAQANLQRQVILEAKVIEVDLNDGFQSGIDWAAVTSDRDFAIGTSSVTDGTRGGATIDPDTGNVVVSQEFDLTDVEFANLFAVGSSSETFGALITLLSNQGNVHILSSPRVSTVNNQKAVIKVGSDEFFVTDISSNTTSTVGGVVSNPSLTLTPFFSGIALDVTPQISQDGEIILHIHPSISEVEDQQKIITLGEDELELPLAFSTVRESDSIVKARNGQVVVIGGLMKNISSTNVGSVPGISEVPVAGELFKQKRKLVRRSELVILLRPIVVESTEVWSRMIQESADRVRTLRPASLEVSE